MISMVRRLKTADIFTIGNFVFGMLAVFLAIEKKFAASAVLILFSVVFDFLDGKIARKLKQENEFGKHLDSFSDLTSFGIWPAVFGYQMGLNSPFAVFILVFFSLCGMLRLARFNTSRIEHFEGIPITFNGILFPLLYFFLLLANWAFNYYILIVYIVMGVMMISGVRIRKL